MNILCNLSFISCFIFTYPAFIFIFLPDCRVDINTFSFRDKPMISRRVTHEYHGRPTPNEAKCTLKHVENTTVQISNSCTKCVGSPGVINDGTPYCHPVSWALIHV